MHAVDFERFGTMVFSHSPVPSGIRDDLERLGGRIVEDVELNVPENVYVWQDGANSPEVLLCRSKSAPNSYRVFKYERDLEGDYRPTRKNFAIVPRSGWRRFLKTFLRLDELAHIKD